MTKPSENTTIALIQLTQQQMGKDISNIAVDIKDIKNQRYVTQNEMQLAITSSTKEISEKVDNLTKIMWTVGGTILLAFLAALIKLVFIQ